MVTCLLEQAAIYAAIGLNVCPGDKGGLLGTEKGRQGPEFLRGTKTAGGYVAGPFPHHLIWADTPFLGFPKGSLADTVRLMGAGQCGIDG